MSELSILSLLTFLPLIGAFIIYISSSFSRITDKAIKLFGLSITLLTFFLSLYIWHGFDAESSIYQLEEKISWVDGYNIFYGMAVDGISILFVILTTFIIPICLLCSWNSIKYKVKEFVMCFLVMETFILGTFLATDLLLFYVFFEAVLIPMYMVIGIWGGTNRIYAAFKFFLYTLAGSVFLLLAIVYVYFQAETTYIPDLNSILPSYALEIQRWLWIAFFASFAVKVPMWPVHTWLPDAHVQAPTAGSVVLAGVLLKLGGYGFIRFSIPFFPAASVYFMDFVFWLSIIAVIYTSLVALMQEDMKKLIAYSSIAHMGFVTAGLFSFNQPGVEGAIFQMISHGIISGALFMCVGVLYDRMHTKEISFYGGLTDKMPAFALQFMIFTMASVALPSTAGFIGEIMVLLGVFAEHKLYSALLATGMVLGAAYMLWLYARVMFGEIKNEKLKDITDINGIEKTTFWPITILIFALGIYPSFILKDIHASVSSVISNFNQNQVITLDTQSSPESNINTMQVD
ncbi:MAG: NADH-quinone oxidoreductase subunit M [Alphaproteobacteria bacterium]|jgi:NADH-quinone oxidoreductase subunit M